MHTLDTSGAVCLPHEAGGQRFVSTLWTDLDPFTQGYVGALFADFLANKLVKIGKPPGFSDLSPEALAMILRDCAAFRAEQWLGDNPGAGRGFWSNRQAKYYGDHFPPLTITLGDDGKVHLDGAS